MRRRQFIKSAGAVGAGLLVLPSNTRAGKNAPSNKLNVALIGAYGRGAAFYKVLSKENVVALCDVEEKHLAIAAKKFPKAKHYVDWRRCLEQKDLDAVVCCTTDHTHPFIANWAMNRGLHVYCEKPLANSVEEARVVRGNYLKNKDKLAVQVGTQRHAKENFNRVSELVRDGAIGELREVDVWGKRQLRRPGYLPAMGKPPKTLHWDLWLGPAPFHPYNPGYFAESRVALNCLQWNMYWDFGTGQLGDMGSHTVDLAWNAIDAGLPTSAEGEGEPFNEEVTPVELRIAFEHPANEWRPAIRLSWYQGGMMPKTPRGYVDLSKIGHGAMFKGTRGTLVASFDTRVIIPDGDNANMSYYRPRSEHLLTKPLGNFQEEWVHACKGDLKTSCDFDYGGTLIEQLMLGLVAYRVGKRLDYDRDTGRVTNSVEANDLLARKYRSGWTLDS